MIAKKKSASVIVLAITLGFASPLVYGAQTAAGAGSDRPALLVAQAEAPDAASSKGSAAESKGACDVPREYVRLINAGQYDSLGGLFADDAVYMGPDGQTRHGSKAIGDFYKKFLGVFRPRIRAASFIQQGSECVMELEAKSKKTGKFEISAIDHFTINAEGKASRFIVYTRPGAETQREANAALSKASH